MIRHIALTLILIVTVFVMIGTLWVSDSYAQQKQYDLDILNFADIAPHQEGEAILIVEGLGNLGNQSRITWTGQVTGSDAKTVSYNGSGTDAIVFPCASGKRYSATFEHPDIIGFVSLHLTDNTGITLFTDKSTSADSNEVSLAGVCGTAPDDWRGNLIDYFYDYFPLMLTPEFLDAVDSVIEQKEGLINETGSLTAKELHQYLIKTPYAFPSDGRAMMLVRYGDSWSGHISAGGDGASYDGLGDEDIEFRCAPGDIYSLSVQKDLRERPVSATLRLAVITNDEILDIGETDAEYGSVSLSGTC